MIGLPRAVRVWVHREPVDMRKSFDTLAAVARAGMGADGLEGGGVVTDVAGIKGPIVAKLDHPYFVGGHPMAGSEQEGVEGSDPEMFEGGHEG